MKMTAVQINYWYYWYENGISKLEKLFAFDTATNSFNTYIINFWDTAGIQQVIDGNGDYLFTEDYPMDNYTTGKITFSGRVQGGAFDGVWKGYYADGALFCEETYKEEGLIEGKALTEMEEATSIPRPKPIPSLVAEMQD